MKKVLFYATLIALFLCLLDVSILSHINALEYRPELVLILLLYISFFNGSITGMIFGFISGILLDSISLATLGLHSFIFVLIGFIIGKLHGKYNSNKFTLPISLTLTALIFKALLYFVLAFIFRGNILVYSFASLNFWLQVASTVIFAPIAFAVFGLFSEALKIRTF